MGRGRPRSICRKANQADNGKTKRKYNEVKRFAYIHTVISVLPRRPDLVEQSPRGRNHRGRIKRGGREVESGRMSRGNRFRERSQTAWLAQTTLDNLIAVPRL